MPRQPERPASLTALLIAAGSLLGASTGCGGVDGGAKGACTGVVALGAAAHVVGVLKADGSLWTWGEGQSTPVFTHQIYDPASATGSFCFASSGVPEPRTCPLVRLVLPQAARAVSMWVSIYQPAPPSVCAVLSDMTLTCRLGDATQFSNENANVQTVAVGDGMYCATTVDGAAYCKPFPISLGVTLPGWDLPAGSLPDVADVKEMVGSELDVCARTGAGAVWCWGAAGTGTAPVRAPTAVQGIDGPVTALAAGIHQFCALREDGVVFCWDESNDQLSFFVVPGDMPLLPAQIRGLPGPAVAIVTQAEFACALLADQTVWCWGYGGDGELGDDTDSHSDPAPVRYCGQP